MILKKVLPINPICVTLYFPEPTAKLNPLSITQTTSELPAPMSCAL